MRLQRKLNTRNNAQEQKVVNSFWQILVYFDKQIIHRTPRYQNLLRMKTNN